MSPTPLSQSSGETVCCEGFGILTCCGKSDGYLVSGYPVSVGPSMWKDGVGPDSS